MDIPEANKLSQILRRIQSDVDGLKKSASANQLASSSLEVTEGQGYIPIYENGVEKHRIGRQPDGTITSVSTNNPNPPVVPHTPVCSPIIGGVTVSCTGFTATQYLDFSHINIYVDGALYGTLMKVPEATVVAPLSAVPHTFQLSSVNLSDQESAKTDGIVATPNLVVGADITNGVIDTLKIANDAITSAKIAANAIEQVHIDSGAVGTDEIAPHSITTDTIAANAITTDQIAANTITGSDIAALAIQAANIAAGAIATDKLAANAVTADQISANAVTAAKIAANAVTAGAIQAGSVDASKLSAQIILATVALIIGDPLAARLVLDSTGITQADASGHITLQIGNTPGANSFTVIDPTDPTNALASIDSKGTMTMAGININGTASLNGIDLVGFLNSVPRGIIARGTWTGSTVYSSGFGNSVGLFELQFTAVSNRAYRITSDPLTCNDGTWGRFYCMYTTDGSTPTVSHGSVLGDNFVHNYNPDRKDMLTTTSTDNGVTAHWHFHTLGAMGNRFLEIFPSGLSGRIRVLFAFSSELTSLDATGGAGTDNTNGADIYIEDLGSDFGVKTGGTNTGTGSSSATGQYVGTYTPTYCRYIGDNVGATMQTGLQQGMAGTVNYMSMLGFNSATLSSDLSGATIQKVELYLYSNYWALTAGGVACVGTHNVTGTPSSYAFTSRDDLDQTMKKPQGLWLQLPTSIGTSFKNNTIKGLVLDSRASNPGTGNYGMFRDTTYTDATVWPSLRITYVK